MRTRYVRQQLPWAITNGSSYILPNKGAERWRLAGVCIASAIAASSPTIIVEVQDGAGGIAAVFEGYFDQSSGCTSLTFSANAPKDATVPIGLNSSAFLPPDLWISPWERVLLRSDLDLAGASVVVTCELDEED
jgi:hypothetical protein